MCAITNHNHFDLQQFEAIQNLDEELLVFPGIELDVEYSGEMYHIILVCEPEKRSKFSRIFDDDLQRNYDTFKMNLNDLIAKVNAFKPEELIIIPHFLDKEKAIDNNIKDIINRELNEYLVILEPAKLQTMGVINAHDELSLIGSDVSDWGNYSEYELPEMKFRISSFKKLYELASEPKVFISNYLNNIKSHFIDTIIKDRILENSIEIYEDINIVFGEKGSGKTKLLKSSIYPYFHEKGYRTYLHEGKDYNDKFQELINNHEASVIMDEEIINNIKERFSSIINYNEPEPANFIKDFKVFHESNSANKRAKVIKKTDVKFSNDETLSYNDIIRRFKDDKQKILKVKEINERVGNRSSDERECLNEQLGALINDLREESFDNYRRVFTQDKTEGLLTAIQASVRKKTGKESKPTKIGFSNLVAHRLERVKVNKELQTSLEEIKTVSRKGLGIIPNKGEVTQEISINVLGAKEKYNEKDIYNRSKIKNNRNIISKITQFEPSEFKRINDYFDYEEKISPDEFVTEVIKKKSVLKIKGDNKYEPSEGEKAILTISGLLEDNSYECLIFDEIERGLGQKYITNYIVPKLKDLRDKGKIIIVSTHNSNIAINVLPSQTIYCNYDVEENNIYYTGNLYTNTLKGIYDGTNLIWKDKALIHLEGSKEMFGKRRNIYGV